MNVTEAKVSANNVSPLNPVSPHWCCHAANQQMALDGRRHPSSTVMWSACGQSSYIIGNKPAPMCTTNFKLYDSLIERMYVCIDNLYSEMI